MHVTRSCWHFVRFSPTAPYPWVMGMHCRGVGGDSGWTRFSVLVFLWVSVAQDHGNDHFVGWNSTGNPCFNPKNKGFLEIFPTFLGNWWYILWTHVHITKCHTHVCMELISNTGCDSTDNREKCRWPWTCKHAPILRKDHTRALKCVKCYQPGKV